MPGAIEIAGLDITADTLLTQSDLANHVVARGVRYHFSVKANQPTLQENIRLLFAQRGRANCTETSPTEHGRIATRRICAPAGSTTTSTFPKSARSS
jgi:predicted transposase YbfD/YdcC